MMDGQQKDRFVLAQLSGIRGGSVIHASDAMLCPTCKGCLVSSGSVKRDIIYPLRRNRQD